MAHRVVYTRPYDAEVEYLESTGTQWINSGVLYRSNIGVECEVAFSDITAPYSIVFRNLTYNRVIGIIMENKKIITQRYITSGGALNIPADTNFHIIKNYPTYCQIDNKQSNVSGTFIDDSTYKIELYCQSHSSVLSKLKIKYFKIYQDTTLVRDFIPVRKGNIGYMYDKVSKQLFTNKGTGNFILGSDVANPVPNIRRVFRFNNKRFVAISND